MPRYHAVMIDECGSEFGVDVIASTRDAAYDLLRDDYPESNVIQLESPRDARVREHRMYARIMEGDH